MTPPTAALPCPFCAKPPEVEECDDGSIWVSCSDSSMKCPAYGNGAELPVWNTRAPAVQATADADLSPLDDVLASFIEAANIGSAVVESMGPRQSASHRAWCLARDRLAEALAQIRKAVSPKAAQEDVRAAWDIPVPTETDNMAMLLFLMIWKIKKLPGDSSLKSLAGRAETFLSEHGYKANPLRGSAAVSGDKQEKERE